ncbi:hypothetical protein GCM10023096_12300 [Nonomuraea ferruginea]
MTVSWSAQGHAEGMDAETARRNGPVICGARATSATTPEVALPAGRYEDDWTRLWWVRADGSAVVAVDGRDRAAVLDALVREYEQYRERRPAGPVIIVRVTRWSGWRYRDEPEQPVTPARRRPSPDGDRAR